eukprot:475004-Amorphochlora_amoeboformis.AAC.1
MMCRAGMCGRAIHLAQSSFWLIVVYIWVMYPGMCGRAIRVVNEDLATLTKGRVQNHNIGTNLATKLGNQTWQSNLANKTWQTRLCTQTWHTIFDAVLTCVDVMRMWSCGGDECVDVMRMCMWC